MLSSCIQVLKPQRVRVSRTTYAFKFSPYIPHIEYSQFPHYIFKIISLLNTLSDDHSTDDVTSSYQMGIVLFCSFGSRVIADFSKAYPRP